MILQASGGRENQESGQDEAISFKNGTGEWKLPGVIIIGEKIFWGIFLPGEAKGPFINLTGGDTIPEKLTKVGEGGVSPQGDIS